MNTKTYFVIYDNQAREISRMPLPNFVFDSYKYLWAVRLFAARRKQDKRCDHWDFVKVQQ